VSGWDTQDIEAIVQKRRMRGGSRRARERGPLSWIAGGVVVLLAVGVGGYFVFLRAPDGLDALPDQAIGTPGGYNATIGPNNTITVGLDVRNLARVPVTLVSARLVAPIGLTGTAVTIVPAGKDNSGFNLDGPLPTPQPVQLGTGADNSDAIVAARFTVDCKKLLAAGADTDESIDITLEVGGQQRDQQIVPPVVDNEQWLTASGRRLCLNPVPTGGSTDQPLPPQPGSTPTAQ
jgi:hypothetical protein